MVLVVDTVTLVQDLLLLLLLSAVLLCQYFIVIHLASVLYKPNVNHPFKMAKSMDYCIFVKLRQLIVV